jgi:quercetin dioxygenase-like cupin family protein
MRSSEIPSSLLTTLEVAMSVHVPPAAVVPSAPGFTTKVEYGQSEDVAAFESELPPSWDGPPPHVHRSYGEAFYVLDGSIAFFCDGVTRDCPTGSFIFVPRGAAHGFANPAQGQPGFWSSPDAAAIRLVESIYQELGRGTQPDPAAMAALYARFGSEILP